MERCTQGDRCLTTGSARVELASMRRPQTVGELMQCLQAVNQPVSDVFSSAGRGCRTPSSAAGGALGGNSTPDQASRVESGNHQRSMEVRAGGCVYQCGGPGGQRSRFVAPEGQT